MDYSVIICTRDRAQQLKQVLTSIVAAEIPPGAVWELIVVDNGSSDATPEVIASFGPALPIRRVFEARAGLSNARNAGVKAAQGDYIIWTDDDVMVAPGWLAAYAVAFKQYPDAALFGGKITPVLGEPIAPWLIEARPLLTDLLAARDFGPRMLPLSSAEKREPFGANYAVRAAEQKLYLYNPALGVAPGRRMGGEEADVIRRILAAGKQGWWVPDSEVLHLIPPARQTIAYALNYYTAAGEYAAYAARNRTPGAEPLRPGLWYRFLPSLIRFYLAHLCGRKTAIQYLIYYAHNRGVLKFMLADRLGKRRTGKTA